MKRIIATILTMAACAGCANYHWSSSVPTEMRSVTVPTFRNGSKVTELGAVATTQLLREFQREGTFRIAPPDEAALEVQGEIVSASLGNGYGDRFIYRRREQYDFTVKAKISVVDRRRNVLIVNGKTYAGTSFVASDGDMLTAQRDASGRAAEDLARQIVDDFTGLNWTAGQLREGAH